MNNNFIFTGAHSTSRDKTSYGMPLTVLFMFTSRITTAATLGDMSNDVHSIALWELLGRIFHTMSVTHKAGGEDGEEGIADINDELGCYVEALLGVHEAAAGVAPPGGAPDAVDADMLFDDDGDAPGARTGGRPVCTHRLPLNLHGVCEAFPGACSVANPQLFGSRWESTGGDDAPPVQDRPLTDLKRFVDDVIAKNRSIIGLRLFIVFKRPGGAAHAAMKVALSNIMRINTLCRNARDAREDPWIQYVHAPSTTEAVSGAVRIVTESTGWSGLATLVQRVHRRSVTVNSPLLTENPVRTLYNPYYTFHSPAVYKNLTGFRMIGAQADIEHYFPDRSDVMFERLDDLVRLQFPMPHAVACIDPRMLATPNAITCMRNPMLETLSVACTLNNLGGGEGGAEAWSSGGDDRASNVFENVPRITRDANAILAVHGKAAPTEDTHATPQLATKIMMMDILERSARAPAVDHGGDLAAARAAETENLRTILPHFVAEIMCNTNRHTTSENSAIIHSYLESAQATEAWQDWHAILPPEQEAVGLGDGGPPLRRDPEGRFMQAVLYYCEADHVVFMHPVILQALVMMYDSTRLDEVRLHLNLLIMGPTSAGKNIIVEKLQSLLVQGTVQVGDYSDAAYNTNRVITHALRAIPEMDRALADPQDKGNDRVQTRFKMMTDGEYSYTCVSTDPKTGRRTITTYSPIVHECRLYLSNLNVKNPAVLSRLLPIYVPVYPPRRRDGKTSSTIMEAQTVTRNDRRWQTEFQRCQKRMRTIHGLISVVNELIAANIIRGATLMCTNFVISVVGTVRDARGLEPLSHRSVRRMRFTATVLTLLRAIVRVFSTEYAPIPDIRNRVLNATTLRSAHGAPTVLRLQDHLFDTPQIAVCAVEACLSGDLCLDRFVVTMMVVSLFISNAEVRKRVLETLEPNTPITADRSDVAFLKNEDQSIDVNWVIINRHNAESSNAKVIESLKTIAREKPTLRNTSITAEVIDGMYDTVVKQIHTTAAVRALDVNRVPVDHTLYPDRVRYVEIDPTRPRTRECPFAFKNMGRAGFVFMMRTSLLLTGVDNSSDMRSAVFDIARCMFTPNGPAPRTVFDTFSHDFSRPTEMAHTRIIPYTDAELTHPPAGNDVLTALRSAGTADGVPHNTRIVRNPITTAWEMHCKSYTAAFPGSTAHPPTQDYIGDPQYEHSFDMGRKCFEQHAAKCGIPHELRDEIYGSR